MKLFDTIDNKRTDIKLTTIGPKWLRIEFWTLKNWKPNYFLGIKIIRLKFFIGWY